MIKFVCSRCHGEGVWQRRGTCFACNGTGYHEYKTKEQAARYTKTTGQIWDKSFLAKHQIRKEQEEAQKEAQERQQAKRTEAAIFKKRMIRNALEHFWADVDSFYEFYSKRTSHPKLIEQYGPDMFVPSYMDPIVWRKAIDAFPFDQYTRNSKFQADDLCKLVLSITNGKEA